MKSFYTKAVLALAVLSLVGAGCNSGGSADNSGAGNGGNKAPVATKNFDMILPADWPKTALAEESIAAITKEQTLQFGIVADPTQKNVVYFATNTPIDTVKGTVISVYKYYTDGGQYERLFTKAYTAGSFLGLKNTAYPVFHVVGYDAGKLAILVQDAEDSPGPCAQPVLLGQDRSNSAHIMMSLTLAAPYEPMTTYVLPADVKAAAEAKEAACLAQIN